QQRQHSHGKHPWTHTYCMHGIPARSRRIHAPPYPATCQRPSNRSTGRYNASMQIGPYRIDPPVALAPMAGVTDKPFRILCKHMGVGLAVSVMTTADPSLWHTDKSCHRMDHAGEPDPVIVQISGYDPRMLADAARHNVEHGAQIIDINMGCPMRKVCKLWSGSA